MTVNVTYREAGAVVPGATTIKNSPLSNGEIDGNFKSVKDAVEVLSTSAGAGLVGFAPTGDIAATTLQGAIAELDSEKVNTANLAASSGSSLVGYDGGTVQDVLDNAKSMQSYTALRAYTGRAAGIRIATPAISGVFWRDDADTTSADNGGTIIVDASGRRWKRSFHGSVYARWFETGSADDTAKLQAAATLAGQNGFKLLLAKTHTITSSINVSGSIEVNSEFDKSEITAPFATRIFNSNATNLKVKKIKAASGRALVYQYGNFNSITIEENDFAGTPNELNQFVFETPLTPLTGVGLVINKNASSDAKLVMADDLSVFVCEARSNIINTPPQHVFRMAKNVSPTTTKAIYFENNQIYDINKNLINKQVTARVMQVEIDGIINCNGNLLNGAESRTGGASSGTNLVYVRKGSLICTRNTVKNAIGTSSTSLIDDKSAGTSSAFSIVADNDFDFTGVSAADQMESVIRVNEAQNYSVHNNKFRGLKTFCFKVYNSADVGVYPANNSFVDNEIYDHDFPVVALVMQNCKNTSINGNKVYKQRNSLAASVNGSTLCRLTEIYITRNNGINLDGVSVKDNTIFDTEATGCVVNMYRNATAVTSDIVNVVVAKNEIILGGQSFVNTINSAYLPSAITMIDNVGNSGVALMSGVIRPARINGQRNTYKNTTANRPLLSSNDVGVPYIDTTLNANGKLIWWTGTAWVDATGATV